MELLGIQHISACLLLWTVTELVHCVLCQQQEQDSEYQQKLMSSERTTQAGLSLHNPQYLEGGEGRTRRNSERELITKIGLVPKEKLNQYKVDAARHLEANLIRCFHALSIAKKGVPVGVRAAAKRAIILIQSGKLTSAIVANLGLIIRKGCQQQGRPGEQLQVILRTILPHVLPPNQGVLQNLLGFVSANLVSVNGLLAQLLGGVPDLVAGVIKSLTKSLGAVTGVLTGSLASLGFLLGGVLG